MKTKLNLSLIRSSAFVLAFGAVVFVSGYKIGQFRATGKTDSSIVKQFISSPTSEAAKGADFTRFWEVWKKLENSYVDTKALDYQKMTWGAIRGLAQSMGDPYTQYLPPQENKQAEEDLSGSFGGVGIELGYKDGNLAVVAPLSKTPADRAGVKAGDLIVKIKDEAKKIDLDTRDMAITDAVAHIRGEKGTQVILNLYRDGIQKPFDVTLTREEIVVPSVELTFVKKDGKNVAHLKLNRFGGRTDTEWGQKIAEIVANNPAGVVLDMRNNPGGYLDGAVYVASEFMKSGVVVQQQGRASTETYEVNRKGNLTDMPLTVLVNGGSASASEIVAGALQDNKRAKILGEKSFGKGTVQEVQDMSDGSSLHVTVAKFLLPSGRWIHKEGITPDLEVKPDEKNPENDVQLDKAVETVLSK
ncbi:MAG: S41 family peptidase [bacterium]